MSTLKCWLCAHVTNFVQYYCCEKCSCYHTFDMKGNNTTCTLVIDKYCLQWNMIDNCFFMYNFLQFERIFKSNGIDLYKIDPFLPKDKLVNKIKMWIDFS